MSVDPLTSTVRIDMSGFFRPSDVQRFNEVRKAEHAQLRCPANQHLTLVDIRDMKIQSQESVMAFAAVMGDPVHASRWIAFIVGASLARQQIQRAAAGRNAAFFQCPEEAEAWLRGQTHLTP